MQNLLEKVHKYWLEVFESVFFLNDVGTSSYPTLVEFFVLRENSFLKRIYKYCSEQNKKERKKENKVWK